MIWNLMPISGLLAVPGFFLNMIMGPTRFLTLWIEIAWNFFYIAHNAMSMLMTPYYVVCFIITASIAMDQRDIYSQNNKPDASELLFEFMGW